MILPLLILMMPRINRKVQWAPLVITMILGLRLGIADWQFADHYRQSAYSIKQLLGENAKVWTVGHWGWQWYAANVGFEMHTPPQSQIQSGHYFIVPEQIDKEHTELDQSFELIHTISNNTDHQIRLSTDHDEAAFYGMNYKQLPWRLSNEEWGRISVYQKR